MNLRLLLVVLVAACSSEGDESAPSGSSTASSAGAAARPAGGALDCDQVLPQALRDTYFKGAAVTNVKKLTSRNGGCGVKLGDKNVSVDVLCDDDSWAARENSTRILHEMGAGFRAEDFAIGKGAVLVDHPQTQQVSAWDDDSNCVVTASVTPPGGLDLERFAADLLAALPPAGWSHALPAVKAACKLTGSCARCTSSADCSKGETCITYKNGSNKYSGCVGGPECSPADMMLQGDALCGTRNKMD
jgi:hypothetical protein